MADKSQIEWCDASWTPIRARHRDTGKVGWACVKVSPGCQFCYSERLNTRRGTGQPYTVPALKDVELFLDERMLTQPLRWTRPRRIFVCSMTDLFMEQVPDEWIVQIFEIMTTCSGSWRDSPPRHTFQILTKRAQRMCEFMTKYVAAKGTDWLKEHGSRIWLGVSAEDQPRLDERAVWLLKTPAAVRFLSLEPLLGPINLKPEWLPTNMDRRDYPAVTWVIVGGESGGPPERALVQRVRHQRIGYQTHDRNEWVSKAEALGWVRQIRDQCAAAGVSFFHKQWGGPTPKSGGRLLDGKEWSEYPCGRRQRRRST